MAVLAHDLANVRRRYGDDWSEPGNLERAVLFWVSDTGEGILSEAFEHIFEKFGQVDARLGGRNMSTGLGLTFCKLAVEAHSGSIGVKSVPGKGSTFSFTIPIPAEACIRHEEDLDL